MKQLMIAAMFVVATAGAATAQTQASTHRHFVDGGVLSDIDTNAYSDDAQTAPGVMVAVGTSLPRHWNVRFEATRPGWHDTRYSYGGSIGAAGTLKYSGFEQHRIDTYSFLFGKDFDISRRATFTVITGLSATRHVDHVESTVETTKGGGVSTVSDSHDQSEMLSALTFGAEVAVAVTPRVSIVPGFRTHAVLGYDGGFSMWRPGVSVRWTF